MFNVNKKSQWRDSEAFIVNFEHILVFSNVSIVAFEQVNVCWYVSSK